MQKNKNNKGAQEQDLFTQIENRYEPGFVQDIRDHMLKAEVREVHYLEMEQMQEVTSRFRSRVRHMVKCYRHWKVDYEREQNEIEKVYKAYEGIFIRQQMNDVWKLYITVNRDYHEMRRTYLDKMCQFPHRYGRA